MAGLFSALGTPASPDRVAVLDVNFNQVFPAARPLNARVREASQLFKHPTETGQSLTDYSILDPIEIDFFMIVEAANYNDTYQQIRNLYLNKTILIVQTRSATYTNMVIGEMPHDERPEAIDALQIALHFQQVQIVPNPTTFAPADPTQGDTQQLGNQNGYTISGVQTIVGDQTEPLEAFSGVPPEAQQTSGMVATGVQTITGPTSIPLTPQSDVVITGVQSMTSQVSIGSAFQ